jgi:hypothetical protein
LITDQRIPFLKLDSISTFCFVPDKDFSELDSALSHPKDFRNNFWYTASARFLAIAKFSQTQDGPYLHVESDVLLSRDFPFAKFTTLQNEFAFPVNSESTGIASTLYIRDADAAEYFADFVLKSAKDDPTTNDMRLLKRFYDSDSSSIKILPVGGLSRESYAQNFPEVLFKRILESLSLFEGIFDAAEFGPFIYGYDPRNFRGFSPIRKENQNSSCRVSRCEIIFDRNRRFLSLVDKGGRLVPIYSLHLHVKRSSLFSPFIFELISRISLLRWNRGTRRIYYPLVFLSSLASSVSRKLRKSFAVAAR